MALPETKWNGVEWYGMAWNGNATVMALDRCVNAKGIMIGERHYGYVYLLLHCTKLGCSILSVRQCVCTSDPR